MSLGELMERFEELVSDCESQGLDPNDVPVMLAHQPSWPFEYSVGEVILMDSDMVNEFATDEDGDYNPDTDDYELEELTPVVYIAERAQEGYLNGVVSRALGWK